MEHAIVLIADGSSAGRSSMAGALSANGWTVIEAGDGTAAIALARRHVPALILMDTAMPGCDGAIVARTLRADPPPVCSTPILACATEALTEGWARTIGVDGCVPNPCTPEALLAAVARWRPDGETAGARRLADVFGTGEIARLVISLRAQLSDAVEELDASLSAKTAHGIAGIAGTLGFDRVSASWLRLSEGDAAAMADARRDARMAIAQIDRDAMFATRD